MFSSIQKALLSPGDHLTETANQAADQVGATFKGEGASGKAMAAGSQGGQLAFLSNGVNKIFPIHIIYIYYIHVSEMCLILFIS